MKAAAMKRDAAFWPGHSNLRLMLLQAQMVGGLNGNAFKVKICLMRDQFFNPRDFSN